MSETATARVTAFGQGRYEYGLPGRKTTVGEVLHALGVRTDASRIAVNGLPAHAGTGVVVDDEVTVVPRVHRG